jgi:hypothetical protein
VKAPRLSRRSFLAASMGVALGALFGASGCHGHRAYPALPPGLRGLSPKSFAVLRVLCGLMVPPWGGHPGAVDLGLPLALALGLRALPRDQALALHHALESLEELTWFQGHLQPFTALPRAAQEGVIRAWMQGSAGQRQAMAALLRLIAFHHHVQPGSFGALAYAGPWVGRVDVGLGLKNRGAMAANPNPQVFAREAPP